MILSLHMALLFEDKESMQSDLDSLQRWLEKWLLQFKC